MEIVIGVLVAIVAIALIGYPLFYARPVARTFASEGEIRQEVDRYRAAIKARTLCERCLAANPAKSNYCSECGTSL
jgi:hypothetical protein